MRNLSPVRVFNALTDGIDGTAMASFQVLSAHDRWSLAFYVFGLRHSEGAAARGERVWKSRDEVPSLAELAEATDGDLARALHRAGVGETQQTDALAFLRRHAPFHSDEGSLARAHRLMHDAEQSYRRGDADAALDRVTAAYLDGYEPVEAVLRSKDAELVSSTEAAFLRVRERISRRASIEAVAAEVQEVQTLLSRAQALLQEPTSAGLAFVAAMTVLLREGVESVLLILLLLGLARRTGAEGDARLVHVGWIGAVVAGAVLWFVAEAAVPLVGASRELIEGVVALLAAGVLLYASHFVLARLDAKRRIEALRRRFAAAGAKGRGFVLISLAFVAVFREAFEVVLFLQAILLESPGSGVAIAGGAAAGLAGCLLLFALLRATGKKLNAGQLLTASGALLCGLAVVMAGKGVHALQEAGYVGARAIGIPRLDWLGVFPTLQTLVAQLLALTAIAIIAWIGLRSREPPATTA